MHETFDESMRALLSNDKLDEAGGGQVIKLGDRFAYRLHGQPEVEGDVLLEINPSATPEVKWRVMRLSREADELYQAFIANPENGSLEPN